MDEYKLITLAEYLNMPIRDNTAISNRDIIVGFAPNIDNIFRERVSLSASKNITTHFKRRDAYRARSGNLCFIRSTSQPGRVERGVLLLLGWSGWVLL
jgi:hypothetical protein